LGESVVLTFLALLIGIFLVYLFTPVYNQLLNKDFDFLRMIGIQEILGMVGLILIVGIAAGLYPAFYLSSFQPVKTLKGIFETRRGKKRFRNSLVVFQFAISVTLIICTILIQGQLSFMKKMDLGFDKENVVVIPLMNNDLRSKTKEMRAELINLPNVLDVTASSAVPCRGFTSNGYFPEGYSHSIMIHVVNVDEHFLKAFDIPVVQGRGFSREFSTDKDAYMINETLARQLNWDNPIGKTISRNGDHEVIGVVKDFKFATLHDRIAPLILTHREHTDYLGRLSVKIKSGNIPETLNSIKGVYKRFSPLFPFEYSFLDAEFDRLYRSEERFQKIFFYFSFLAIFIALLGLFTLSSYSARQKAKEIGIRKVLGASIPNILSLFTKELTGLILTANLLAWPAAYFLMNRWLTNFAFRDSIRIWVFFAAMAGSLLAASVTISFQSLKAAYKNPVEELRDE
jgi:putative ABC transport system permease protein